LLICLFPVAGYSDDEISKINLDEITGGEVIKLVKERVLGMGRKSLTGNTKDQIAVPRKNEEDNLVRGYEFITESTNGKGIMKLP
jgi:hypothetical protein